jgi:hypothetical protein
MIKPGEELFYSSVAPATPAGLLFFIAPTRPEVKTLLGF